MTLTVELAGRLPEREAVTLATLRRLEQSYDLAPWTYTPRVRIAGGEKPHSHPVLTLNTLYRDLPHCLLALFLHEQMHWRVAALDAAARRDLCAALATRAPFAVQADLVHVAVCALELDALAGLLGEGEALRTWRLVAAYRAVRDFVLAERAWVRGELARFVFAGAGR